MVLEIEPIQRLSQDLRKAATSLSDSECRYLVDTYYQMQGDRIRSQNQLRSISDTGEPNSVLNWLADQQATLEGQIKDSLNRYTKSHPVGEWMQSVKGIGPVISAGMLAHIDMEKAKTAGAIWRYAGLDPTVKWGKGQKRPWNATLKTLCWKAGESFVKVSGKDSFYGSHYKIRKQAEEERNEAGELADEAARALSEKTYGKTTDAYKAYINGKLPPAHIHARATRWTVKLFLSHLHEIWWEKIYDEPCPRPYVMVHLGHVHKIEPPREGG